MLALIIETHHNVLLLLETECDFLESFPHTKQTPLGAFFSLLDGGAGAGMVLRQKTGAALGVKKPARGITVLQRWWILFLFLDVPGLARWQAPGQVRASGR